MGHDAPFCCHAQLEEPVSPECGGLCLVARCCLSLLCGAGVGRACGMVVDVGPSFGILLCVPGGWDGQRPLRRGFCADFFGPGAAVCSERKPRRCVGLAPGLCPGDRRQGQQSPLRASEFSFAGSACRRDGAPAGKDLRHCGPGAGVVLRATRRNERVAHGGVARRPSQYYARADHSPVGGSGRKPPHGSCGLHPSAGRSLRFGLEFMGRSQLGPPAV